MSGSSASDNPLRRDNALAGVRVAVTRPATAGDRLAPLLAARGADVADVPLLRIAPPPDTAPLMAAAHAMERYDWIVFTSANAVVAFGDAVEQVGTTSRITGRIAAVGPATAEAVLAVLGRSVDAMPDRFTGAAIAATMEELGPLRGRRVLWPRAVEAREALERDLQSAGALLDAPAAYATLPEPAAARRLAGLLEQRGLDAVTFTSPSAVRCLAEAHPRLDGVVVAVIGPSTAEAARSAALPVHVEPEEHTIPGLVEALAHHYAQR